MKQEPQDIAQVEASQALADLNSIRSFEITSAEDYEATIQLVADVKAEHARVDAIRKSFVSPLNEVVARINAFFRPPIAARAEAEVVLKSKILAYRQAQEVERERLMLEAERHAVRGHVRMTDQAIAKIESAVVPEVGNFTERIDWVGEVIDESKLPREYLMPDISKLLVVTKTQKSGTRIPGWRAFSKSIAIVRQVR